MQLDQAKLGMPGREYLIKGLEDKDVKAYLEYQVGLATLLGADAESARKEQTEAVEFEIKLATVITRLNLVDCSLHEFTIFCRRADKFTPRRAPQ